MVGSRLETPPTDEMEWSPAPENAAEVPVVEFETELPPAGAEPGEAAGDVGGPGASDLLARFREYQSTRSPRLRTELIMQHHGLAQSIARRFSWPGFTSDDLLQIARIGLIHAVDRYDPGRGVRFATFATHTIAGEVKRYLRDYGWPVKIPRCLREMHQQVRRADELLTRRLRRPPSAEELAEHLHLAEEAVVESQKLARAAALLSIETPVAPEEADGQTRLGDHLGGADVCMHDLEMRLCIRAGVDALDPPQRDVVRMRYFDGLTQAEVAERLRLSQMHISRLERRALARLRLLLADL